MTQELITIQVGSRTNNLFLHYWNIALQYESKETLFLHREGQYRPRLISIDSRESVGDFWKKLEPAIPELEEAEDNWEGEVKLHEQEFMAGWAWQLEAKPMERCVSSAPDEEALRFQAEIWNQAQGLHLMADPEAIEFTKQMLDLWHDYYPKSPILMTTLASEDTYFQQAETLFMTQDFNHLFQVVIQDESHNPVINYALDHISYPYRTDRNLRTIVDMLTPGSIFGGLAMEPLDFSNLERDADINFARVEYFEDAQFFYQTPQPLYFEAEIEYYLATLYTSADEQWLTKISDFVPVNDDEKQMKESIISCFK